MSCRAATLPPMPTACERFDQINVLAVALSARLQTAGADAELRGLAADIQNQACIGAAYERRRERGETINEGSK